MRDIFNLNGIWNYYIDFDKNSDLGEGISLNDSNKIEREIAIPDCWEQHEENKAYDGPVWMKKSFTLDFNDNNTDRLGFICFDGVSYYCEVFLNGKYLGKHEGQWDGFRLDATGALNYMGENELLLKIYKQGYDEDSRFHYRESLSGFIPDVACTFGGIWRDVYVASCGQPIIKDLFVKGCGRNCIVEIELDLVNQSSQQDTVEAEIEIFNSEGISVYREASGINNDNKAQFNTFHENCILWDTEKPYLYKLEARLLKNGAFIDSRATKFGFRNLEAEGSRIRLNERNIFVRGILHWGYISEIAPNPSKEEIIKEIQDIKDLGFNLIKFCLYIPTKAYLEAADELGMLVWIEFPLWLPRFSQKLYDRINSQYINILKQIRNHPSIIVYSLGCELNSDIGAELLRELYMLVKNNSGSSLVRDNSGSGECYEGLAVDFADFYDYHFYCDLNYIEPMMDAYTPGWREKRPWMFGEFCDFDTFRSPVEIIERREGYKPWWMENDRFKNPLLNVHNCYPIMSKAEKVITEYLKCRSTQLKELSKKKAIVHRKYTIETVRSYPEVSGYVVTSVRDCPLATSGMYDDYGNIKFETEEFCRFNNDSVLALRWDIRTKWNNGGNRVFNIDRYNYFSRETIRVHIVLANYSQDVGDRGMLSWKFVAEDGKILSERSDKVNSLINEGSVAEISVIELIAPDVMSAQKINLYCEFENAYVKVKNEWPFWVYPVVSADMAECIGLFDPKNIFNENDMAALGHPEILDLSGETEKSAVQCKDYDVIIATELNLELENFINGGGKVFYIQNAKGRFKLKSAPFWRECVQEFIPHMINEALKHEDFADFQFVGMASDISFIPEEFESCLSQKVFYKPVIRRIDCRNYEISDYLVDVELGKGRMIATTLRLNGGAGIQPSGFTANTGAVFLTRKIIEILLK